MRTLETARPGDARPPGRSPAPDLPTPCRLPLLLRRAWFGLNQAFRRRIARLGLTPDQYTVLRTLQEASAGELTQRGLTAAMASDPNTVASLLERMEQSGLVRRERHARDRRARSLHLTATGQRRFRTARQEAVALQAEVLRGLPAALETQFLDALEQIASACQRAIEASPRMGGSRRAVAPTTGRNGARLSR